MEMDSSDEGIRGWLVSMTERPEIFLDAVGQDFPFRSWSFIACLKQELVRVFSVLTLALRSYYFKVYL